MASDEAGIAGPWPGVELEPGSEVGPYRLGPRLGSGSSGTVYEAEEPTIGRHVALKVLSALASADPAAVERFVVEARAVNQVRHRNIADVSAIGTLPDGRRYLVMELVRGQTLAQRIAGRGPMPLAEVLPLLQGIAAGLDAAHQAGIVHRDLKPDNILVAEERGEPLPKIIDFGLARLLGETLEARRTASGALLGTPRYMSPEQCRGLPADARADVYAFGLIAYEMLCGRPPFIPEAALDLLIDHAQSPPPLPSSLGLSPRLDPVLLAPLEKRPERRPDSAGAVVEALASLGPLVASVRPRVRPGRPLALVTTMVVLGALLTALLLLGRDRPVPSLTEEHDSPPLQLQPAETGPPPAEALPAASVPQPRQQRVPARKKRPGPDDTENPFH